jgi:hypothetical protein
MPDPILYSILRTVFPPEQFDPACLLFWEYAGETLDQVRDLIQHPGHPDLAELNIRLWNECQLNRSHVRRILHAIQISGVDERPLAPTPKRHPSSTKKFQSYVDWDDN